MGEIAATPAAVVRTYTQPGTADAGLRGHGAPLVFGAATGITAGAMTLNLLSSSRGLLGAGIGAAAIGLASGLAAFGATWAIRGAMERQPALPDPGSVPQLPDPAPLGGPAFDALRYGQQVGHASASWTETRTECDSDGKNCHIVNDREWASGPIRARQPVGDPAGYASLDAAHRSLPLTGANPYVIVEHDGRFTAWTVGDPVDGHWGSYDLDTLEFTGETVVEVVTPGGRRLVPDPDRRDRRGNTAEREVGSLPVPDRGWRHRAPHDAVASYAVKHGVDRAISSHETLATHPSLERAIADVKGRPGAQAVVADGGRFDVRETTIWNPPRPEHTVTGLRTSGRTPGAVALEAQGTVWSRAGAYWATTGSE